MPLNFEEHPLLPEPYLLQNLKGGIGPAIMYSGIHHLYELLDVNIPDTSAIASGHVLVYNPLDSRWEHQYLHIADVLSGMSRPESMLISGYLTSLIEANSDNIVLNSGLIISTSGWLQDQIDALSGYIIDEVAAVSGYVDALSGYIGDHGNLNGLSDDDHKQYLLADGTRNVSGSLTAASGLISSGILTVHGAANLSTTVFSTTASHLGNVATIGNYIGYNVNDGGLKFETDDEAIFTDDVTVSKTLKSDRIVVANSSGVIPEGTYTDINASQSNLFICRNSNKGGGGSIEIQGLSSGILGQVVKFIETDGINLTTFKHNDANGVQKIYSFNATDLTISADKACVELTFDGTVWWITNNFN